MTLPDVGQVRAAFGDQPLVSGWLTVTQDMMDAFAEATDDHDWMHVDPERARREGPFDGTIAFGFWTVSMLTTFMRESLGTEYPLDARYGFNYGLDRVRFTAPVPVGRRVRNEMRVTDVTETAAGRFLVKTHNEVTVEGGDTPAMVADWLFMLVF